MTTVTNSGKPKLAYVVHTLNPGGTERLVVDMSIAFSAEFDMLVVCLDEPGTWAADVRARGIPVECVWREPGFDASLPGKLARLFRRQGTQIVHAHQCTPWFYAALSRLIESRPRLLLEEHGRFYPEADSPKRRFVNRHIVKKLTHRFVAVSADVRQRLERYEGLDASRIEVVYNGVSAEAPLSPEARATARQELGFAPDAVVVGTVGRFDPIKNLPMLVESLARVSKTTPSLRGLLVGAGPVFADISGRIVERGLAERVHLTGFRSDARRLVQCMDLFVLASFSEGTSMALLEAMAAGVPVAVTNVGGNPEIVTGGETGWVVTSDAVDELTAAISEAAGNPQRRQEFAARGRQRFLEKFAFDRMIENYRQRYGEMLRMAA